jgi:hypothetical protein
VTEPDPDPQTKVCPQCAEEVKAAALICRFCRYEFAPLPDGSAPGPTSVTENTPPLATSSGTPDSSVPRSRADLTVELERTTQQWALPRLLGKFDAVADFRKSPDSISETPQADEPRKGRTSLAA